MGKNILISVVSVVLIALLCVTALNGLTIGSYTIPPVFNDKSDFYGIRLGLDLVGGSVVTFEAQAQNVTADELNIAQRILRERLDKEGYTEATITKSGEKRLRLEIPEVTDPEQAIKYLGQTAKLEFRDANNKVLMNGDNIDSAKAKYDVMDDLGNKGWFIELKLKDAKKFAEATKAVASKEAGKNILQIVLDETAISSPSVDAKYASTGIDSDSAIISGQFTKESAKRLADIISAGRLPFALKDVELRSVGPQLGEKALETSLFAGLIGLILVMIFMTIYYRLPGFISSILLVFYVALVFLVLAITRVNLSLPGIAGVILSIGMAVDASVVIFERIKEELRNGKTIKSAIDSGFHRAFTAILDSNLTTVIAAAVLWFMGVGPIKGFAVTLFLGVVISMFIALVITPFYLRLSVDMKIKNPKVYGA